MYYLCIMFTNEIFTGFFLTLLAGLSTGIGSALAFFAKRTDMRFLSGALGLSAGVMIYISFMELMPECRDLLVPSFGESDAELYTMLIFFFGIAVIALIDRLVPEDKNPHEAHLMSDLKGVESLNRTGTITALAIFIHNVPEGMATFATALVDVEMAIPIMVAIAIHNIPEGIAVSVPIFHATGNRRRAFWISFFSGMAEPVGALAGYLFLRPFWSPELNALLLAFVSGVMVYISFDELLPGTERFGHHHTGVAGVVMGMAVMALTLWMGA